MLLFSATSLTVSHAPLTPQLCQASDNAALLANHQSGTPVRVFRTDVLQQEGPDGRVRPVRMYVYEGLYQVTEHRSVPSQDGVMVSTDGVTGGPGFKSPSRKAFQTLWVA